MNKIKRISQIILIALLASITTLLFVGCSCSKQVDVDSVVFEEKTIDLRVGEFLKLSAYTLPSDATNQKIYYECESVDNNGNYILEFSARDTIVARNEGVATITAKSIGSKGTIKSTTLSVRVYGQDYTLPSPTGLKYQDDKVVWDTVSYSLGGTTISANGYIVNLNGVDQEVSSLNEFTSFDAGVTNNLTVRAVGNGNVVKDSNPSSTLTFKVLSAPTNIVRQNNTLSWDLTDGASTYNIYVNNVKKYSNILTNKCDIDFSSDGNYAVSVRAVPSATDTNCYESKNSNIISVTKLKQVANLKLANGILSWDSTPNASSYKVIASISGESFSYLTKDNTYSLSNFANDFNYDIDSGELSFTIKAVNNSSSGIDGNESNAVKITKLASPSNIQIENDYITWAKVTNASGYGIKIDNDDIIGIDSSKNSYILDEKYGEGQHTIKLIAYADNINYLTSSLSNDSSALVVNRLAVPTNVEVVNNLITFNGVNGAKSYQIIENGKTTSINLDDTKLVKNAVTGKWEYDYLFVGSTNINDNGYYVYNFVLKAIDGVNSLSSNNTNNVEVYKLKAPINLSLNNVTSSVNGNLVNTNKFTFTNLANGFSNKIKFEYGTNAIYEQNIEVNSSVDFSSVDSGEVILSVKSVGNGKEILDSDYSTGFSTYKMEMPTDLKVVGNLFTFTVPKSVDEGARFDIYINGSLVGETQNQNFVIPDSLISNNDYKIYVVSMGTNTQLFSNSPSPITATKLSSPIINFANNKFTFNTIANATSYEVYFNNIKVDNPNITIDNDSKIVTFIPKFSVSGNYDVNIRAVGNVNGESNYISSSPSNTIQLVKLNSILSDNINIKNGSLVWTYNYGDLAESDVKFIINCLNTTTNETISFNTSSTTLDLSSLSADSYKINIYATYIGSVANKYIDSNELSTEFDSSILSTPTSLTQNVGVLSWVGDEKANGYTLLFTYLDNGENKSFTKSTLKNSLNISNFTEFNNLSTTYTVKVMANGNDFNILSSGYSSELSFKKLGVVSNLVKTFNTDKFDFSWDKSYYINSKNETVQCHYEVLLNGVELEVVTSNNYSYNLSLFVDAKDYKFTVRSVATESVNFIPSLDSNEIVITKFDKQSDFTVKNGYAVWMINNLATNYKIDIYQNDSLLSSSNDLTGSYSLNNLTSGDYKIGIVIVGDNNSYVDSDEFILDNIKVLDIPSNIKFTDKKLVCDVVSDAVSYKLHVSGTINGITFEQDFISSSNIIDIPSSLVSGTYNITITAIGNNTNIIDSKQSSLFQFIKLSTISNLSHNNNIIKFDQVAGVTEYEIKVSYNGNETSKNISYTTSGYTYEFKDAGEYIISVKTLGNYIETIDSSYSSTIKVVRLEKIQNLLISNGIVSWDSNTISNNYIINVYKDNSLNSTKNVSTNSYKVDLSNGTYKLGIICFGDKVSTLNSDEVLSDEITILPNVESLSLNKTSKTIDWTTDNLASSYDVKFEHYTSSVLDNNLTRQLNVSNNSIAIPTDLVSGSWVVSVRAIGNNTLIIDSVNYSTLSFTKLASVSDLNQSSEYIKFTKIDTINSYLINIKFNNQTSSFNFNYDVNGYHYSFSNDGDYTINVITCGDYISSIDSDVSNDLIVTRLIQVSNLTVSNNIISWSPNAIATSNNFKYSVEFIGNNNFTKYTTTTSCDFSGISSGNYTINVKTMAGDEIRYLPSSPSSIINVYKLESPIISSTISASSISWSLTTSSSVEISGYDIHVIDNGTDNVLSVSKNITSYLLEDKYGIGTYTIYVVAKGNKGFLVDSEKSNEVSLSRLESPTIYVERTNLTAETSSYSAKWNNISNAINYKLIISKDGTDVYSTNVASNSFVLDDYFNGLDSYPDSGEYSVKVVSLGNDSTVINSASSNIVNFYLPEVSLLSISDGNLSWTKQDYAYNYALKIGNKNVVVSSDNFYELGNSYSAGDYKCTLQILTKNYTQNSLIYINSVRCKEYVVTKLSTPEQPTIIDGTINVKPVFHNTQSSTSFDYQLVYGDKIKNFEIASTATSSSFDFYSDSNTSQIIKLRALAKVGTNEINSSWSTSAYSDLSLVTKGIQLTQPSNFTLSSEKIFSWSQVSNASGYKFIIYKSSIDENTGSQLLELYKEYDTITTTTTTLPSDVESNTYKVCVKAIGGTVYTNSLESSYIDIIKYDVPNNISIEYGTLTWNSTSTKATVIVDGGENPTVQVVSIEKDKDGNETPTSSWKFSFSKFGDGKHTVSIVAKSDSSNSFDSNESIKFDVYKYTKPTLVTGETDIIKDGMLTWQVDINNISSLIDKTVDTKTGNIIDDSKKLLDGSYIFQNSKGSAGDKSPNVKIYAKTTSNNHNTSTIYTLNVYINLEDITVDSDKNIATILLNKYFDELPSGEYEFKISMLGNSVGNISSNTKTDIFVESNISDSFTVNILPLPAIIVENNTLTINDSKLKWNTLVLSDYKEITYLICIKLNDDEQKIMDSTQAVDYNISTWESSLTPYSIFIRVKGDNSKYLSSTYSNTITSTVMMPPSTFNVVNGKISWIGVEGADYYMLQLTSSTQRELILNSSNTSIEDGAYKYELDSSVDPGTYQLKIRAIGDNINHISSIYEKSSVLNVTKINISGIKLGNTNGKITFTNTTGAKYYVISAINSDNVEKTANIYYSDVGPEKSNCEYDSSTKLISYILGDDFNDSKYTIKVKAIGNSSYDNSGIVYLNSNNSSTIVVNKVSTPLNVRVLDGKIYWDKSTPSYLGYYLVINNEIDTKNVIQELSAEIPNSCNDTEDMIYSIRVVALGNTVSSTSSATRYLISNYSDELIVERIVDISSFNVDKGVIKWGDPKTDKIDDSGNVNCYELTIAKENGDTTVVNIDRDIREYDLAITDSDGNNLYSSGNYTFTIKAVGRDYNGVTFINSRSRTITSIKKLDTPSNFKLTTTEQGTKVLNWDKVTGTNCYKVIVLNSDKTELENKTISDDSNTTQTVVFDIDTYMRDSQGSYNENLILYVLVEAVPNDNDTATINSNYTNTITLFKPMAPTNLIYDQSLRAFTWDPIPNEENLDNLTYIVEYLTCKVGTTSDQITNGTSYTWQKVEDVGKARIYYPKTINIAGEEYALRVRAKLLDSLESDSSLIAFGTHNLFDSGSGSETDPYIINNVSQFAGINLYSFAHFKQGADFALTYATTNTDNITCIGSKDKPFTGYYDGNGHTISSLQIKESNDYVGLFRYISNATITNVIISSSNISITHFGGIIVGYSASSIISNCNVSGYVTISSSITTNLIYIGGIAGYTIDTQIANCINRANISATINKSVAGGIVGYSDGIIIKCANIGSVTAVMVGGIVGESLANISYSYNKGSITANADSGMDAYAGGLIGMNNNSLVKNIVKYCYNVGVVSSNATITDRTCYSGGCVAYGNTSISNFFNYASVTAVRSSTSIQIAGQILGYSVTNNTIYASISTTCYYVTQDKNNVSYYSGTVDGNAIQCSSTSILSDTILSGLNTGDTAFEKGSKYPTLINQLN